MKKIAAIAIAAGLMFGLSACDDIRERQIQREQEQIELGKQCFEAGGQWVYDGWGPGWICEFRR